jgi:hypothetical protein
VARLSYIFNSDMPKSKLKPALGNILVILALFAISEILTTLVFTPCFVPAGLYQLLNPAKLSYGFDKGASVFYQCGSKTLFIGAERNSIHVYETLKSTQDIRIFTLGGSVSLEPTGDNYSIYLETMLRRQAKPNETYHVINTSTNGYGTTRMLVLMEQILETNQKPDLVIIHPHGSNEYEDEVQSAYYNEMKNKWYNQVLFKSKFFLIMKEINQLIMPDILTTQTADAEMEAEQDPERALKWRRIFRANLGKMCHLANTANVPIIVVLRVTNPYVSSDNTFADDTTHTINADTYESIGDCENVYILDTPKVLEQLYPNPTSETIDDLFVDTTHWTSETHQIVATQLLEVIESNNLLPVTK